MSSTKLSFVEERQFNYKYLHKQFDKETSLGITAITFESNREAARFYDVSGRLIQRKDLDIHTLDPKAASTGGLLGTMEKVQDFLDNHFLLYETFEPESPDLTMNEELSP